MAGSAPSERFFDYWQGRRSSGHRQSRPDYFAVKADEHARFIHPADRHAVMVDIGCGAGELLVHLQRHLGIRTAIDFSPAMLDEARTRLAGSGIALVEAEAVAFLPTCDAEIWLSCEALNQYLAPQELRRMLDIFCAHPHARAIYLFDTIDPVRFLTLPLGIGYVRAGGLTHGLRQLKAQAAVGLAFLRLPWRRTWKRLPSRSMGYGYLPAFWHGECDARGLTVEMASSRFYEYRYHLAIAKPGPERHEPGPEGGT